MENLIWAKTLLNIYSNIEKYITKIDATVNNISIIPEFSVDEITKRIINLSDRKYGLINLKLIIEKLIANCKPKYMRLLSLKHINHLTVQEIAKHLNISERTTFRLYKDALNNYIENMHILGYTSNWLYQNLKEEKWILHEFFKEYSKEEKINLYKKENIKIEQNELIKINQFHNSLC